MKASEHDDVFTLRWYRDKGRGQEAADATGATQTTDTWPMAILPCADNQDASRRWWTLLKSYGVNATTWHPFVRSVRVARDIERAT